MVRRLEIPHEGDDLTDWRKRDAEAFPAALHTAVRSAPVVDLTPEPTPEPPKKEVDMPATDAALAEMDLSSRQLFDNSDVGVAVRLRDFMARDRGRSAVRRRSRFPRLGWNSLGPRG
ncbi:DNA primase/helicase OS=Streptomyces microflavus OX=1919 GN=Smic_80740 PE=4 SV=1 [Streptomyces microflavus]